jgi:uncharacterized protein (TIGR03086 family)
MTILDQVPDLVALDRRAVETSVSVVSRVTSDQLEMPTPCVGWALGDLLAHMTAQHLGFAAAAYGNIEDRSVWRVRPAVNDPATAYAAAARRVIEAFARVGVLDRAFWLPEIRDGGEFSGQSAVGFHLVDYVVHAWDVAVSIGVPVAFASEVIQVASAIAKQVPDGDARQQPGAAFQSGLPTDGSHSEIDQILLFLGRDPQWRALIA